METPPDDIAYGTAKQRGRRTWPQKKQSFFTMSFTQVGHCMEASFPQPEAAHLFGMAACGSPQAFKIRVKGSNLAKQLP